MATFNVRIECDNAAFDGESNDEIARILRDAAHKLDSGHTDGVLKDVNGNLVGMFWLGEDVDVETLVCDTHDNRNECSESCVWTDI